MSTNLATSEEVKLAKHTAVQRVPKSTLIIRRFCRNTPAVLGLTIFVLLALLAIAGPYLSKYRYDDPTSSRSSSRRAQRIGSAPTSARTCSHSACAASAGR